MNRLYGSKISILVAARNEEAAILRCLKALDALSFPKDSLQILIGDDASTDRTYSLAAEFIADKPWFELHEIPPSSKGLRGKTNVLAWLARRATGAYLLFTDADIAVPRDWVQAVLAHFEPHTGVVVGLTRMQKRGMFADLQSVEWLYALGMIRVCEKLGIPVTGMGNNMAVRTTAYLETGGYEHIGFSIVEDYALFHAILQKGFGFRQSYEPAIIAESLPVPTFRKQLIQRKRWMAGVMSSPLLIRASLVVSALHVPLLLLLWPAAPALCLSLILISWGFVTFGAMLCVTLLKQSDLLKVIPVFWFYFNLNNLLMLVNYLLPTRTVWKDRTY